MTRVHGARFPEYDAGFRVQGAARWTPLLLLLLETERAVGVQTCTLYQYCDRRETNRHGITSLGLQGRGTTPTRRVSCDVLPSACSFLSKPGSFTRRAITLYTLSSEQIIIIHLTSLFLCSHTRENQTNALKTYCLVYSAYSTTCVAYSTTAFHLPLFPHRPLSFPPPCPSLPPPPRARRKERAGRAGARADPRRQRRAGITTTFLQIGFASHLSLLLSDTKRPTRNHVGRAVELPCHRRTHTLPPSALAANPSFGASHPRPMPPTSQ